MRIRSLLALATACAAVTACAGLKDAFSAHSNVVATAGSQQLTVERLGGLIGHTQLQIQPTKENIDIVAGLWVDYQLLAEAAAKGDSLNNPKEITASTQTFAANEILRHFEAVVDSGLIKDGPTEAGYDAGASDLYDARHILFQFPAGATAAEKDSVHKKALSILPQVNAKNFAEMAKKYSADGSASQGGNLGVFVKSGMVPEFANAVAGLKPGQISGLVQTQFGYHIIQRLTYAEAKADYDKQYPQMAGVKAERAYFAKIDSEAGIQIKAGAAQAARVAALDPANHRKDNTQLTSFNGGNLTISRFLMWMDGFPAQQNIPQQLQSAPDSLVQNFLRSLSTQEVMLKKADSMHITLSADDQTNLQHAFAQWVAQSWSALDIDPKMLADSAKSSSDRGKLAAARADSAVSAVLAGKARPIALPQPLKLLLESKYDWKINPAGLARATEIARGLRTTDDSARAAAQPPSQVPLPGPGTNTKKP